MSKVGTLADLLPRAAERWPERLGVVDADQALSWAELNRRSGAIASHLISCGVNPGDRVALHRHKSATSFEAVHGVLRAGAVVVPVDPKAPESVVRAVLDDAEAVAVIGDRHTLGRIDLSSAGPTVVESPAPGEDGPSSWRTMLEADATSLPSIGPADPAYIVYTSGSTGVPKGLVHTHGSAMAYAGMTLELYEFSPADRMAGMNPFHFDMSTLELYAGPLSGATVIVMSESDMQFPASFTARAERERVTIWYGVPFFLRQVLERGALDDRDLTTLRWLLYGGEPFPAGPLAKLMGAVPGARVSNVYGPAEVNQCTYLHLDTAPDPGTEVPIGLPTPGTDLRVLGSEGEPVAVGRQGELWVASPSMMLEYLKRPELNEQRFEIDADGRRWYRTGDVVVEGNDGLFRFEGRRDHQIKIRGIRLELESVEAVLSNAPGVVHAVAGPIGPAGDAEHVAAAVVLEDGTTLDRAGLRRWCADRLPAIGVPRHFVVRFDMPKTPSGKIDRRSVRRDLIEGEAKSG